LGLFEVGIGGFNLLGLIETSCRVDEVLMSKVKEEDSFMAVTMDWSGVWNALTMFEPATVSSIMWGPRLWRIRGEREFLSLKEMNTREAEDWVGSRTFSQAAPVVKTAAVQQTKSHPQVLTPAVWRGVVKNVAKKVGKAITKFAIYEAAEKAVVTAYDKASKWIKRHFRR
uniref:Senescence domain-containing protein n=1 Tax=Hydatigena taeniaeformis TaxID=6205 RepID=A0A0R3WQI5_HYDTA